MVTFQVPGLSEHSFSHAGRQIPMSVHARSQELFAGSSSRACSSAIAAACAFPSASRRMPSENAVYASEWPDAVIAFACCSIIAACLTINYGEFLTNDVARKMHGKTVHVPNPGEHPEQKEILDEKASA